MYKRQAQDVEHGGVLCGVRAHVLGRGEGEPAREDRQPPEQAPFLVVEQPVAPLQRGQQCLLPRHAVPGAPAEQRQRVVQAFGDLTRRQDVHPGRRELQGQGHPVEPEADLGHGRRVLRRQPESRVGVGGALREQPDGGETAQFRHGGQPARIRQPERGHPEGALAVTAQCLPAGREDGHAPAAGGDPCGQRRTRVDQVLAVVQYQQHLPGTELCDQVFQAVAGRREVQSQRGGDGFGHEVGFRQCGEVHEAGAVPEVFAPARRHGQREPGLAAAAGPGEGQQSAAGEQVLHLGDLTLPADEGGRGRGQRMPGVVPGLRGRLDRVGQQLAVEAAGPRVGVGAGVAPERVPQLFVAGQRLPAAACGGQDPHQGPVAGLVQRVVGDQGPQHLDRVGLLVIVFQRLGEAQPERRAPRPQRLGRLAHPGLVAVLGQQADRGEGERGTVVRGRAVRQGPPGGLVERVEVDVHAAVRAEQHHVVAEDDDIARGARGGQGTPYRVQRLVQVVGGGRPVQARPQKVVEPLPVQAVAR